MPSIKFTDAWLEEVKTPKKQVRWFERLNRGVSLVLTLSSGGSRSWGCLLYDKAGRSTLFGLKNEYGKIARYPMMSLATARQLALDAFKIPVETRSANFRVMWTKYISLPNQPLDSFQIGDKNFIPYWRDLSIGKITPEMVLDALQIIVDRGSPAMANRALATLKAFYNWCIKQGAVSHSPCDSVPWPAPDRMEQTKRNQRNKALDMRAAYQFVKAHGLLDEKGTTK